MRIIFLVMLGKTISKKDVCHHWAHMELHPLAISRREGVGEKRNLSPPNSPADIAWHYGAGHGPCVGPDPELARPWRLPGLGAALPGLGEDEKGNLSPPLSHCGVASVVALVVAIALRGISH